MNNLLKNKIKVYRKGSSGQESYETESYCLVEVVDESGIFEKEMLKKEAFNSIDEVMSKLYECTKMANVTTSLKNVIDSKRLNLHVTISDYPSSERHVKVELTKRGLRDFFADWFSKVF